MAINWSAIAEATLQECLAHPVTQHEAGGPESELGYLRNLGHSHIDTVTRVGAHLDTLGKKQPRVLEMGAYFGIVSVALARGGAQVTAQDLPRVLARPALQARFEKEGITSSGVADVSIPLPYADASFDALVCCEMLEHLPFNTVRLIRELRRILAPGGFAFLSVPNQASAKRRLQLLRGRPIRESMSSWIAAPHDDNWHWREYVAAEFAELLHAGGFTKVALGYRHFTPPAHPNPIRRALVNLMYRVKPDLMDDIHVFAS